jgi:hypothetical protein
MGDLLIYKLILGLGDGGIPATGLVPATVSRLVIAGGIPATGYG